MAIADPRFNVSTRPVLKDTPRLANVSFGLSVLQNGLMNFFVYCFSLGAVSPAAVLKRALSNAALQVCMHKKTCTRKTDRGELLVCFFFFKSGAIAFYLSEILIIPQTSLFSPSCT